MRLVCAKLQIGLKESRLKMSHAVNTYSFVSCTLGESPVWMRDRNSFVWLDILNKCLFEKTIGSHARGYQQKWNFEYTPTAVVPDAAGSDTVFIIADDGIHRMDIQSGEDRLVNQMKFGATHRPNDGSVGPDGTIYFGTMQHEPDGRNGRLYSFSQEAILRELPFAVGIPNTFVWLDSSHVAISDSFEQRLDLYKADKGDLHYIELLYDFSSGGGEPDGGAIDQGGVVWIALWGRGQVVGLDPRTKMIMYRLGLPVSRPSSCCFGGPGLNYLFITSAVSDDESVEDQGGNCFIVKMKTPGVASNGFSLCR